MSIDKIDYSTWKNQKAIQLAKQADTDGIKGLQGKEIFNFAHLAIENNIEQAEVKELLGFKVSPNIRTRGSNSGYKSANLDFSKAVNFYNDNMDSSQRYAVTRDTNEKTETRLYNLEKDINKAFQDCEAYSDIVIVPRWHYRFYPRFNDRLINFDIDELRARTSKDMEALHKLKDTAVRIYEEANGETTHAEPKKTKYDVDEIAKKHFGMSYEEFKTKYAKELEYCKYVTYADYKHMDETQAYVYGRAKAYAEEMLTTTITEAHTVNWDISGKTLDETMKASNDLITISDFEYNGITEKGLADIQSGIVYKSFEEALTDKYKELNPTGIEAQEEKSVPQKTVKRLVNGMILIFKPDGTIYDLKGNKIK